MKTIELSKIEKKDVKHMTLTNSFLKSEITRDKFISEYEKQLNVSLFEVVFFYLAINNKPALQFPISSDEISILHLVNLYNLRYYHQASGDLDIPNEAKVFLSNKFRDINKFFTEQ